MKLGFLRPLYQQIGGYVSVYLDTSPDRENAPAETGLRWRAARDRLAGSGADPATLNAAEAAIINPAEAAPGRVVFARAGAVAMTVPLAAPPRREIARLAPLPHVMPLLAQRPPVIPHVRVAATRTGGEIVTVGGNGRARQSVARGEDWPVHKTSVGGWSQASHQRSAEERWDDNAKHLASQVTAAAERARASHVIVGGDVRARTLLLGHLSPPLRESAVMISQEVAADSPAMTAAADQALAAWSGDEARQRLDNWRSQQPQGRTAEGLAETTAALRDGQVAELFVADRPDSTVTAWIGPEGTDLACAAGELPERDGGWPVTERADAAIARAAATTGGELYFLPADLVGGGDGAAYGGIAHPRDGICATLRYPREGGQG